MLQLRQRGPPVPNGLGARRVPTTAEHYANLRIPPGGGEMHPDGSQKHESDVEKL